MTRTFKTLGGLQRWLTDHPGRAVHLLVLHDDACTPSRCTCRPEYELRAMTAESLIEGERLEREWKKAASS